MSGMEPAVEWKDCLSFLIVCYGQQLPKSLVEVIDWFHQNNANVWIVGGAIRNALLGTNIVEFDLATTLTPDDMKAYPDTIPTGERYGTITFRNDGDSYEVTTLRTEFGYNDGRRPDEVQWGDSLLVDLSRRDLTMNSLAVDPVNLVFYDPFDGQGDLQHGRIRSVGDATKRLSEDALRIMRSYRFMDQGAAGIWWPERQLADALRTTKPMLKRIARERIWSEFKRILLGRHASEIVQRMADDGILKEILDLDWEQEDVRIKLLNELEGSDVIDRLVVLLRDFSSKECEQLAARLRLSGQEKKRLLFRHAKLGHLPEDTESKMRVFAVVMGTWGDQHLCIEKMFAREGHSLGYTEDDVQQRLDRYLQLKIDLSVEPLASGEYIMQQTNIHKARNLAH